MSELPKHVQAGLDQANAIQQKLRSGGSQPTPAEPTNEPTEAPAPEPRKLTPVNQAPVVDPAPSADESTWEQRYRSFKGHADAELRRAHDSVESMRNDNAELRSELKALKASLEEMKNPPEPKPEPPRGATEEDIESFGTDMVGFVNRVSTKAAHDAMAVFEAKLSGIMGVIDEMRGTVSEVDTRATQSAEGMFFAELATKVPDYMEINGSLEWKNWLQEVDVMSGAPRQVLLSDAQNKLAVDRVASIFNTFKREMGIGDASATKPSNNRQVKDLENQVSPPRSKQAAADSHKPDGTAKVWTQAEISEVYGQAARGKLPAEEFQRLEKEINEAVRTGRVR